MKYLLGFLLAILFNTSIYSQIYISDNQSSIKKGSTQIEKHTPTDRIIKIDTIKNTVDIELVTGEHIMRKIKFVEYLYEVYDVYYKGFYETDKGEKLYIRNSNIAFNANNTLGAFYTYSLKNKGTISHKERTEYEDKREFEYNLQMYGRHTADCVKNKIVQNGISTMVLNDIFDSQPLYREDFLKGDTVVSMFLYKDVLIRAIDLTVDQIIYSNKQ